MTDNEMESENFLTHIRFKSCAETNISRIEKRTFCRNERRNNYNTVAKRIKVPNLDEFRKLCRYFSRDKKAKDLELIHLGLANDSQYIKVFLETQGALYALIGCFSGINTRLQMEAIYCILNLCLGTEEQSLQICKSASTYLVTSLGTNNSQLQSLCCWAFGNMCGTHQKVCGLLLSQGFEEAVEGVMCSTDPLVVQGACYALNHYLNTVPERIVPFCKPEVIKRMLGIISLDKELVVEGCWCLFTISTVPDLCPYLVNFGLVSVALKALYEMVENGSAEVNAATALVRILSNCVAGLPKVAIEICYQADHFVSVIKLLLFSPYNHLQKETLQLVANVINGAAAQPITGENILEDSNLKRRLEPILSQSLVSQFDPLSKDYEFVAKYS